MTARKIAEITKIKLEELLNSEDNLLLDDIKALLHDLQVHQSELEMQNEELRDMQFRLEESRDQYFDLFDNAPIGYFILDEKGMIINVNLTGCSMLGFDRNQVKGKPFSLYLPQDEQSSQIFFTYLKKAFQSEELTSCELFLKNKNGTTFPVQLDGMSDFDEGGFKSRIRITLQDRSTEKETEKLQLLNEALKREKDRAQLFLDVAGTMFVLIDSNHIIQMINQKGCEILGCKEGSIVGENWFEKFILENEKNQAIADFDRMMTNDYSVINQKQRTLITQNGQEAIISCHHAQIRDEEDNVIGLLCSGVDITEQKEAENALIESERMFRKLFETAAESIVMTNGLGEIVAMNTSAQKMFGYGPGEAYGQPAEILMPGEQRKIHKGHQKEFHSKLQSRQMGPGQDLYAQKKDGTKFPVEISLSSYNNGDDLLVMAVISDITERKKATQKLESLAIKLEKSVLERTQELIESQELYKKIAHNFPNGLITILDKNLNYTFVEGTELIKMGVVGEALLGTCFIEQMDLEHRDDIEKKMNTVLKGKNITFELKSKKKTYMINAVGMHDSNNNINQILMVSQNITPIKRAEQDIKRALIKEQNLNELKTRFVSMASHEFRTPLTTTMNSISLIEKYIGSDKHEEKQRKHVSRIKSAVHNLSSILSDFLSMDKLEQGAVEARSSEFSLPAFSKEIIEIIAGMATRGQFIRSEHHGEEFIFADKQILKNILNNLLSNALKYSYDGTEIILQTVVKDNVLTICVKDYGIGIPEEEQSQLFERFFRGQNALNIQGTGLGLNIVKGYLDLLKGDINFVSELNKGTTFIVKIPLEKGRLDD